MVHLLAQMVLPPVVKIEVMVVIVQELHPRLMEYRKHLPAVTVLQQLLQVVTEPLQLLQAITEPLQLLRAVTALQLPLQAVMVPQQLLQAVMAHHHLHLLLAVTVLHPPRRDLCPLMVHLRDHHHRMEHLQDLLLHQAAMEPHPVHLHLLVHTEPLLHHLQVMVLLQGHRLAMVLHQMVEDLADLLQVTVLHQADHHPVAMVPLHLLVMEHRQEDPLVNLHPVTEHQYKILPDSNMPAMEDMYTKIFKSRIFVMTLILIYN